MSSHFRLYHHSLRGCPLFPHSSLKRVLPGLLLAPCQSSPSQWPPQSEAQMKWTDSCLNPRAFHRGEDKMGTFTGSVLLAWNLSLLLSLSAVPVPRFSLISLGLWFLHVLRWLMGLTRPSLPVVLASSSINRSRAPSETGPLRTCPSVAQNSTVIFIQQDWGESVCTWKAWI